MSLFIGGELSMMRFSWEFRASLDSVWDKFNTNYIQLPERFLPGIRNKCIVVHLVEAILGVIVYPDSYKKLYNIFLICFLSAGAESFSMNDFYFCSSTMIW